MTTKEIEEAVQRYHERRKARMANTETARAIIRYKARRAARIALRELRELLESDGDIGVDTHSALDNSIRNDKMDANTENGWVTMKGTHVLLGEGGEVVGGPPNFKGKKYPSAKSQTKSAKGGAGGGGSGASSGGGGGSGGSKSSGGSSGTPAEKTSDKPKYKSLAEERAAVVKMSHTEKADYLVQHGILTEKEKERYLNGTSPWEHKFIETMPTKCLDIKIEEESALEKYAKYGAVQARGHLTTSQLPPSVNGDSGGRRQVLQVMRDTGLGLEEATELRMYVNGFSRSDFENVRAIQQQGRTSPQAEAVERYINLAPTWNGGKLYRGISVSSSEASRLIDDAKAGKPFDQKGTSSWSSTSSVAKDYANSATGGRGNVRILYRTPGTRQGTSIRHMSKYQLEDEVIISQNARWKATSVKKQGGTYVIDCEELNP